LAVKPPKTVMRAIVLGSELPRALAVIRSLGRAGIDVVVLDHREGMPGRYSRYVCERHVQDHNAERPAGYGGDWYFSETRALEALDRLAAAGGGLLIPTNDDYLRFTARHHERLAKSFVMSHPPWSVLQTIMDKFECYRAAPKWGLDIPNYFTPQSEGELRQVSEGLDYSTRAYLLRTNVWISAPADPQSGAFTRPAGQDAATLQARAMDIVSRTGVYPIIQEVVRGEADSCIGVTMLVDRNHEPMLTYCLKRLKLYTYSKGGGYQHPYELGANVFAESVHDDEAVEAARIFAQRARFYGVITVEFRRDARDSKLKFIKADPRVINPTSLSTALGMDIPLAAFRYFAENRPSEQPAYRDGVVWIWLDRYVRTLVKNRGEGPARKQLLAVLKRLPRLRAFGFLSLTDRKPMYRTWQKEWQTRFGTRRRQDNSIGGRKEP